MCSNALIARDNSLKTEGNLRVTAFMVITEYKEVRRVEGEKEGRRTREIKGLSHRTCPTPRITFQLLKGKGRRECQQERMTR